MENMYVVRHCKAEGQTSDALLTAKGIEEADKFTDFFFNKKIEYIISSPKGLTIPLNH